MRAAVFLIAFAATPLPAAEPPRGPGPEAVSFGFGLDIAQSEASDRGYAAIGLSFEFGEISFGRPRSALDDPRFSAPGLSVASERSLVSAAAASNDLGPGVQFRGAIEGLSVTSSWHRRTSDETDLVAVTGRYDYQGLPQTDTVAFYGGAETDGTEDVFRLGTSVTRGRATAGLDVTREGGADASRVSQLYIGLEVGERLLLGIAGARRTQASGDADPAQYGVGAEFNAGNGRVLSGGVTDLTGDDPTFGFSVGFQF